MLRQIESRLGLSDIYTHYSHIVTLQYGEITPPLSPTSQDQEIKHLNEVKQTLFDLDGRSLASRMSQATTEVLSDGCLSDSAMEPGRHGHKGDEKKKKKWKVRFFQIMS